MVVAITLSVAGLFLLFLGVQQLTSVRVCALCAAVSVTWLVLLALYLLGYVTAPIVIAVLMGESVTGVFYLLERKTSERLHLFRLPALLTLTLIVLLPFIPMADVFPAALIVIGLWSYSSYST